MNSDYCYCGSGKKFKSCCKSRVNMKNRIYDNTILNNPMKINSILTQKIEQTDYKICFHPDKDNCKKPIKNAHTLQSNGVLSILAENNQVRVVNLLYKAIGGTSTREVRKSNATTFYGFCEYHDSVVFSEIENIKYEGYQKQNFLYAYRTCAQEFHKKNRQIKAIQSVFKDNPTVYSMPGFVESYKNIELSFKDVEKYINIFNDVFETNNYDILDSYIYKFDKVYDFAVTAMFNPTYDLEMNKLNDIYSQEDERLKSIFVSVIPTIDKSYLLISYLKEDSHHFQSYINQIKNLTEDKLKIYLNNLLPTYSENIVLSPRLWERWTPFSRREFEKVMCGEIGEFDKLMAGEMPFDSIEDFFNGLLIKDGINDMTKKSKYDFFKL